MYLNVTPIKNLKVNTKESYPKASFGALLLEHSTLQPKSRTCSKVQCLLARENRAEDEEMLPTCGHFRQQLENYCLSSVHFSRVRLFATPRTAAHQASLSITNSWSLLKVMSIESVMPLVISSCLPLPLLPSIFLSIRVFSMSQFFASGGQSIGVSALASVLPMDVQDRFPLGWTGWILQSKGLSRVFSKTTVQKHQFFGAQLSL